jgi:hypothetical protein
VTLLNILFKWRGLLMNCWKGYMIFQTIILELWQTNKKDQQQS